MRTFISCDWGTSNLRVWLVNRENLEVIESKSWDEGISVTHHRYKSAGGDREAFFKNVLRSKISQLGLIAEGTPLVISGMASSSIGMREVAYIPCPIDISGENFPLMLIAPEPDFSFPLYLVSGLSMENEVLRGEETLLIGGELKEDGYIILPGTHSKHVIIENGQVVNFKTFMTGEIFSLLREHSVLHNSIDALPPESSITGFREGLETSRHRNVLNSIFQVRVNDLFGKFDKRQNTGFLSGLLIGSELNGLENISNLTLIGTGKLAESYQYALQILYPGVQAANVDATRALIAGQSKLLAVHMP